MAKLGPDHPHVGFPLNNIGTIEGRRDRWTESLAAFDETLRIWRAALPEDHPLMAYGLTGRGKALIELGRRAEALPDLEAAYRLRQSEKDPELRAETSFALARALERGDRARTLAESALADARKAENLEELVSAAEAWLAAP